MKSSTRDKFEGVAKNIVGHFKTETGKLIGNPRLQAEGDADQVVGNAQRKAGEVKKVLGK